ncbi:MAG: putative non-F420 flavinoid oxidoreductase [Segetibacter sp.]|nr:putative non-F420 flavinoid oxidoreductase [Segetibacter sp.]
MIGYQASHEQFAPSELLRLAILAEKAGFKSIHSSDHFHPWSERQGHSGFSFAWLGAAMQATSIPYGVITAPGQRYHPAIVAQAIATLAEMFPNRFEVSLGSGEALNERITGEKWPIKSERNERLLECFHIIKQLLNGETVTHFGRVTVEEAKLYTLPATPPKIFGAAVTPETAEWMGGWADGLLTVHLEYAEMKKVIQAFRRGGGEGKPMYLKTQLSFAATDEEAIAGAHEQWRTNIFKSTVLADLWKTEQFDAAAKFVQPEELHGMVRISSNIQKHIDWIKRDLDLGFEKITLHNVNKQQDFFINEFGDKVLPKFY